MTPLRLKYVQAWVDGEGRAHHYFRRRGYPRVRLPGLPGSSDFMAAYQAALSGSQPAVGTKRTKPGSVNAALVGYYTSQAFRSLTGGTPQMRRAILERFRNDYGDLPIAMLQKRHVIAMLDKLERFAAGNWLKALRHFMRYCVEQELVQVDPTQGVMLARVKTDGHHSWTDAEVAQYEAAHPIGGKARLALALGLYTAQRRGDVVKLGRQHIRDGALTVRQEKTGVTVVVPIHPNLKTVLDAMPSEHLTFLTSRNHAPYAPNGFTKQFRAWCDAAGLPEHCGFHGLRKAALTRLAEAGGTVHEIAAISGHTTLREIERYTKAVNRERLAREGMARWVASQNAQATTGVKPHPDQVSNPLMQLKKKPLE